MCNYVLYWCKEEEMENMNNVEEKLTQALSNATLKMGEKEGAKIEGDQTTIPSTLEECMEDDVYAKQILGWSKILEKFGKWLFIILIILGVIVAFYTANQEVPYQSYYGSIKYSNEFNAGLFFGSLATWALYSFIEYCTYHAIALLLGGLAMIVQNTKVSASVSLYEANKGEK